MKIVFMGTPQAAVPSLTRLVKDGHDVVEVWTQPDRPSGRGRKITASPVKQCAERLGIPVFQPSKIKSRETRDRFVSLAADVAVVVAYGRILTKTYLESYSMGCINVHFSLLPKYRGAAPVNWAIANCETKTGVTTMKMDAGLDTGDILLTAETEIAPTETAPELMERLSIIGADLLVETLDNYTSIEPRSQEDSESSLAPLFHKSDGRIDWTRNADTISCQIRGFQPFPRSFSDMNGRTITFWQAVSAKGVDGCRPGEVIEASGDAILICCGSGSILRVTELQAPGKPRMTARDFLNGDGLKKGDVFISEE